MTKRANLDTKSARKIAVAAEVDPRTVQRVWAGKQTKSATGERVKAALKAAGLLVTLVLAGCGGSDPPRALAVAHPDAAAVTPSRGELPGAPGSDMQPVSEPDALADILDTIAVQAPDSSPPDTARAVDNAGDAGLADAMPADVGAQDAKLLPDYAPRPDVYVGDVPPGCTNEVTNAQVDNLHWVKMDCWRAAAVGACPHLVAKDPVTGEVTAACRAACGWCEKIPEPPTCGDVMDESIIASSVNSDSWFVSGKPLVECREYAPKYRDYVCAGSGWCDRTCGHCQ